MFKPIVEDAQCKSIWPAALEIIYVATGKLAAYITPRLQPDFAGGPLFSMKSMGLLLI